MHSRPATLDPHHDEMPWSWQAKRRQQQEQEEKQKASNPHQDQHQHRRQQSSSAKLKQEEQQFPQKPSDQHKKSQKNLVDPLGLEMLAHNESRKPTKRLKSPSPTRAVPQLSLHELDPRVLRQRLDRLLGPHPALQPRRAQSQQPPVAAVAPQMQNLQVRQPQVAESLHLWQPQWPPLWFQCWQVDPADI